MEKKKEECNLYHVYLSDAALDRIKMNLVNSKQFKETGYKDSLKSTQDDHFHVNLYSKENCTELLITAHNMKINKCQKILCQIEKIIIYTEFTEEV